MVCALHTNLPSFNLFNRQEFCIVWFIIDSSPAKHEKDISALVRISCFFYILVDDDDDDDVHDGEMSVRWLYSKANKVY